MKEAIKYYLKSILSPGALAKLRTFFAEFAGLLRWINTKNISMDKLLWGGEQGTPAAKYSRITGNLLRPSTRLRDTPHVDFLHRYQSEKENLFKTDVFTETRYCKNAVEALDITGDYFGYKRPSDIIFQARRFVATFMQDNRYTIGSGTGISSRLMPILVRRIAYSDGFYEIVDGHHRLSISYVRGATKCRVHVLKQRAVLTPLQQRLLDVFWTKGLRLLYQPVDAPEIGNKWKKVRRCTDRRSMMVEFLRNKNLLPPHSNSYLDIGSSYGWFLGEMTKIGFEVHGVDRDWAAVSLGPELYGIDPSDLTISNLANFLENNHRVFDITSCFSVLHHFILGNGPLTAEILMGHIDRTTAKVLFLDTGQNHELWFKYSLPEWDPDYIEQWIKQHSSFKKIYRLGKDNDATLPGQSRNYGRTLFACTR